MIRFFSHIRRRLIDAKGARKYILYALGEILLVVIGILIALQVDNWNDDREKEAEFRIALSNLLIDLRDDMRHFSILDSVNAISERNAALQLDVLTRPNTLEDVSIFREKDITFMNLDYTRDTYTSIVNSDVFHHSRNHHLKAALSDYYREAGDTEAVFERIISWVRDLLFKDAMLRYRFLLVRESIPTMEKKNILWMDNPDSEEY